MHNLPSVSLTTSSSFYFSSANYFSSTIFVISFFDFYNNQQQFLFSCANSFSCKNFTASIRSFLPLCNPPKSLSQLIVGSQSRMNFKPAWGIKEKENRVQCRSHHPTPALLWKLCFVCFLVLSHISGRSLSLVL